MQLNWSYNNTVYLCMYWIKEFVDNVSIRMCLASFQVLTPSEVLQVQPEACVVRECSQITQRTT